MDYLTGLVDDCRLLAVFLAARDVQDICIGIDRRPDAILGFTLFSIPLEEVFFFVTQTYDTGLLDTHTYMSLILAWVTPFLTLQWAAGSHFLLALPRARLLLAVALPSVYLCMVDTLALRRGTWVIEDGTKLGYDVLGLIEVEEVVFFFATNLMIVVGLVTIDYYIAMEEYQMASSPVP
ncbi:hypothetical protein XA68_12200 [Ophiocordyceps unilateralis]|uniref:Lycopene cyclase domain-containing protein n=1 Tax=Ophiocordyceps unilateralis TaxID=268505 RepID=A0A2A9PF57_OPHUN|nr:hypothetical protein XA68_12200 [Ophiocordyceps unilateralis]